jgi:hypothetical protein
VEVSLASGVPNGTPLLAAEVSVFTVALVLVPDSIANSAAIWLRLEAESAVISKARGAWLPADGTDTVVSLSTVGITKSAIFFLTLSAGGNDLSDSSAICVLPAVGGDGECGHDECEHTDGYFHCLYYILYMCNP